MSIPMTTEEAQEFVKLLAAAIQEIDRKNSDGVRKALLEFRSTAIMLGFEELDQLGREFETFFDQQVEPRWDSRAVASLSHCMEELAKGLQISEGDPELAPTLHDLALYLRNFPLEDGEEEETEGTPWNFKPPQQDDPMVSPRTSQRTAHNAGEPFMNDPNLLRALLQIDPTSSVFVLLAEQLCKLNLWQEAVETCRQGVIHHPSLLQGQILLGWALWETGRPDEAEDTLRKARENYEKGAIVYKLLGEMAARRGAHEEADELYSLYEKLSGASVARGVPEEPPGEERTQPGDTLQAADGSEKGVAVAEILSGLLERFSDTPPTTRPREPLFSADDRERLKNILRAASRGVGERRK